MPGKQAASSSPGKGSPGKRRGRRGPNASKRTQVSEATRREAERVVNMTSDELSDRRSAQVEAVTESARMKNKAALGIMADQLGAQLAQRDFLLAKMHKGDITSDESKVLNGLNQKVLKTLAMMGVDELRDPDDCPDCNGEGEVDGEFCETCDGRG